MAEYIEDYDVGDDTPVADYTNALSVVGDALATISAEMMTSGHIHEGNSRVWVQTFDPRFTDATATEQNAALRPGDIWINADYVAWQAGDVTDPPALWVYDAVSWQPVGEVAGGVTNLSYTHNQTTPAATWTVVHNLGYHPNVTVVDTADSTIVPGKDHQDINTLVLHFAGATAGKAYCS